MNQQPKVFTSSDIVRSEKYVRIYTNQSELIYSPLPWQERGLMQTSTGYGKKLNTGYKINFDGKLYRIYCCIYSNAGTSYFTRKGEMIIID